MRSVISCFNGTLFRKNLARFWPIWGLYGVIWLFVLPIQLLIDPAYSHAQRWPLSFLDGGGLGLVTSVLFGVLAAMAVFSYLYNNRSVGLMHALPGRREGLFLTNYLSGLAFLVGPNLIVFFLALFVELGAGILAFSSIFTWLVVQSLLCFFFYSLAVFCAMLTGHILALPAFYIIFNGLATGVALLFQAVAELFLFGFTGSTGLETGATWLTPLLNLVSRMNVYYEDVGMSGVSTLSVARFSGLGAVFLYAFIGLVLAGLALLLYHYRHLESAGDVVAVRWVRPIFKYSVGACAAMALGILLYVIFDSVTPDSSWVLLLFMLIGGFAGYFIAEMLLRKSVRVFRRGWKGCLILLACVVVAMCALEFDLGGFEGRVPEARKVKSVSLSSVKSTPYDELSYASCLIDDPEQVEALLALHQAIVDDKDIIEGQGALYNDEKLANGLSVETEGSTTVNITYSLTNGDILQRSYTSVPVTPELLADPTSPAALLNGIINDRRLVEDAYFEDVTEDARLIDASLTSVYDPADDAWNELYLSPESHTALLEAIRADIQAGNLGRRYLLQDEARLENCYISDLVLIFSMPQDGGSDPAASITYPGASAEAASADTYTVHVTIGLQASATETLAVLAESIEGFDLSQLITHADEQRMNNSEKGLYN